MWSRNVQSSRLKIDALSISICPNGKSTSRRMPVTDTELHAGQNGAKSCPRAGPRKAQPTLPGIQEQRWPHTSDLLLTLGRGRTAVFEENLYEEEPSHRLTKADKREISAPKWPYANQPDQGKQLVREKLFWVHKTLTQLRSDSRFLRENTLRQYLNIGSCKIMKKQIKIEWV